MTFAANGNWLGANWCIDVLDDNGYGVVSNLNVHHISITATRESQDIWGGNNLFQVAGRQETEIYIQILEADMNHEDINNLMHSSGTLVVKPDPRSRTDTRFENSILTNVNWEINDMNDPNVVINMLWKSYSNGMVTTDMDMPQRVRIRPVRREPIQKLDWRKCGF